MDHRGDDGHIEGLSRNLPETAALQIKVATLVSGTYYALYREQVI